MFDPSAEAVYLNREEWAVVLAALSMADRFKTRYHDPARHGALPAEPDQVVKKIAQQLGVHDDD